MWYGGQYADLLDTGGVGIEVTARDSRCLRAEGFTVYPALYKEATSVEVDSKEGC